MNFIIKILMFLTFFTSKAIAVEIYKCEIDKRTEIAGCGFYIKCINSETNKEYTNPFVHSYDFEASFTVLAFKDKLIVKRDYDKYEYVFEKSKNGDRFYIGKDWIQVSTLLNGSFNLIDEHFYHELSPRNARFFHSGKCKKQ